MIHRCRTLSIAFALLLGVLGAPAQALSLPQPPSVPAKAYVLLDHDSGQLLASANPDEPVEPASITKLMTTYILFDEIKSGNLALDDQVTISEQAWRMGGSKMFIEVGKQIPVVDLLRGMIIISGNDATLALAEHVAGSEESFAGYMNQYASDLGLTNSHFVNVTGWPAENHYMSARDIATLAGAMIRDFPDLYERFYQQKEFTWNDIKQYNRNSLLWTDPSVDGVKTGHTESAGYCLAASAEREGMRLISVVTGTSSNNARKSASSALLNYGFRFYQTYKLFDADKPITEIRVWKGDRDLLPVDAGGPVYVTAPRGGRDKLATTAEVTRNLVAPVEKGRELGTLNITFNGDPLHQRPLYAGTDVGAGGLFQSLIDEFWLLFE